MKFVTLHTRECPQAPCTCGGWKTLPPRPLLPSTPAGRLECLLDLYAPKRETGELDDDGEPVLERTPGAGIISEAQFTELMNMPYEEPAS
jgi:hypothetical protein